MRIISAAELTKDLDVSDQCASAFIALLSILEKGDKIECGIGTIEKKIENSFMVHIDQDAVNAIITSLSEREQDELFGW